jgi:pilus assembly protein CpaE
MAAILEFDESTANSIANALGSNTFLFTDASQLPAHMNATGDPLVIIGPSVDQAVAERVTATANMANPTGGVVWLRRRVDTTVVLEALRAGASDVIGDSDLPALVAAANRVAERATIHAAKASPDGAKKGAVVTSIYAPKGGCGKTSIAANLAVLLSGEMHSRVCLLDLDLESGDIQLIMSLPPSRCVLDLQYVADSLDATALASVMLPHSSGTYVLAAPQRPEQATGITPELIARIVAVASQMFDHVIIDCPPYATEHVLAVLDVTDHLGLICTPDAASVKNTAISLELLSELRFAGSIDLIVNRAGERVGISATDIAEALDHPVTCEIPHSVDMPLATNSARLLSVSHPQHAISMAIRGYATYINPPPKAPQVATVPAQQTANKRRRLFGRRVATT